MFKFSNFSPQLNLFAKAADKSKEGIFLLFFLLTIATIFFGTTIFYAETVYYCTFNQTDGLYYYDGDFLPDMPSEFQNIPESMWWAIVTMITVGYGDLAPNTPLGKVLASITFVASLLVLSFPIGIISKNLSDVYDEVKRIVAVQKIKRELELAAEAALRVELISKTSLQFTLRYNPKDSKLCVRILDACDVFAADDNGLSDPYCVATILPDKTSKKTKVINATVNPSFDENLEFSNITSSAIDKKHLRLELFDHDKLSKNDPLGFVVIALNKAYSEWDDLFPPSQCKQLMAEAPVRGSAVETDDDPTKHMPVEQLCASVAELQSNLLELNKTIDNLTEKLEETVAERDVVNVQHALASKNLSLHVKRIEGVIRQQKKATLAMGARASSIDVARGVVVEVDEDD